MVGVGGETEVTASGGGIGEVKHICRGHNGESTRVSKWRLEMQHVRKSLSYG